MTCALQTGLCNITTAVALKPVIFCELLGLSEVGVSASFFAQMAAVTDFYSNSAKIPLILIPKSR